MSIYSIHNRFNTHQKCVKQLEKIRWNGIPECPYCESTKITKRKLSSSEIYKTQKYHCNPCNKDFTVLTDTIFEGSKLTLPKWFMMIGLMLAAKKGISANQISRDLEITYKTAWYCAMRIRCAMLDWGEMLEGVVEMDETFVGGKPRKRNQKGENDDNVAYLSNVYERGDAKVGVGRGTKKVPVAAIIERKGRVVAKVMENLTSKNLIALLKKTVNTKSSVLMTDDYVAYKKMDEIIERYAVNHSAKEYVRGNAHTNTIEGFWSIIKNGIRGQYHVISKKYLPFYLAEFCYRYNRRQVTVNVAFDETLVNSVTSEKCFEDYKPKGDVKKIVYPRRKKHKKVS